MTTVTKYAVDGPIILHHIVGILRTKDGKVTVESNYNLNYDTAYSHPFGFSPMY